MRSRALRPCAYPGCNALTRSAYCESHQQESRRYDLERGTSAERGYNVRWRKARITYLQHHPLCVECEREGKITPATVVDHIKPHKGNKKLFWDKSNWQSMCKSHHDAKTRREDMGAWKPRN